MARFFEEEAKHAVVGKRILELASGTGILGLHLGLMGAKHVVMTDKESMKQLLQGNIAENKIVLASTGNCCTIEAANLVSVPASRCCQFDVAFVGRMRCRGAPDLIHGTWALDHSV